VKYLGQVRVCVCVCACACACAWASGRGRVRVRVHVRVRVRVHVRMCVCTVCAICVYAHAWHEPEEALPCLLLCMTLIGCLNSSSHTTISLKEHRSRCHSGATTRTLASRAVTFCSFSLRRRAEKTFGPASARTSISICQGS
jgi:hypothetical protein